MTGAPTLTQQQIEQKTKMLESLPPEQRAKMDALLKDKFSGKPSAATRQTCITPEQAAKGLSHITDDLQGHCKTDVLSQTTTVYHFHALCADPSGTTGTMEGEARLERPDYAKFSMRTSATNADGKTTSMSIDGTSKWLGADCSNQVGKP